MGKTKKQSGLVGITSLMRQEALDPKIDLQKIDEIAASTPNVQNPSGNVYTADEVRWATDRKIYGAGVFPSMLNFNGVSFHSSDRMVTKLPSAPDVPHKEFGLILSFDTKADSKGWYYSPEYTELKKHRLEVGVGAGMVYFDQWLGEGAAESVTVNYQADPNLNGAYAVLTYTINDETSYVSNFRSNLVAELEQYSGAIIGDSAITFEDIMEPGDFFQNGYHLLVLGFKDAANLDTFWANTSFRTLESSTITLLMGAKYDFQQTYDPNHNYGSLY